MMAAIPERDWLAAVLDGFRVFGWTTYHTHDSRHSAAGFPDVVAVHPVQRRVVWVECKTERGRLTDDQRAWAEALAAAGQEVYCWRPSSWASAERVMRGERLLAVPA
jgi:hypothetical protein